MNNIKNNNKTNSYCLPENLIKNYLGEESYKNNNSKRKTYNKNKDKNNFKVFDTGTVTWFDDKKGIGYITSDTDRKTRYFFHVDDIKDIFYIRIMEKGFKLKFKVKKNKKSWKAYDIYVLEANQDNKKTKNSRIQCPNCGREIIPRLIIKDGTPTESVCPFCGETVKKFNAEGCFIATAVYGTTDCYELEILRKFRDNKLKNTKAGALFVKYYYKFSPPIAKWLKKHSYISYNIKVVLNLIVKLIEKNLNKNKK